MNLAKGALLKVVVTQGCPEGRRTQRPRTAKSKTEKRAKPPSPVPALLLLSSRADQNKEAVLDLDSRTHRDDRADRRRPPDARPHQLARCGFSGARDRASLARQGRSSPRADAGRARALADVSQDAAQPQDQRQARSRRLHDRKGCPRDLSRLHAQRQPLPAGESMRPRARDPVSARPLGRRANESRGPAALYSMGQARLHCLHVRHGRLQRQQAVHSCRS